MGGPIVRTYGMPNWDDIFGKKKAEGKKAAKATTKKKKSAKKVGRK